MKKFLPLMLIIFSFSSFAGITHVYKMRNLPNESEVLKIKNKSTPFEIEICCHYPEKKSLLPLFNYLPQKIKVIAGAFPTNDELMNLENLNTKYEIHLSEVFASDDQIKLLNKSNISKLVINSKDFPTTGEVEYLNKLTIPTQVNFNIREFPLPEHMVVIKKLKKEITVGFSHRMTPGPGQVNFFKQLKNKLIFHVGPKFPYGEDANGLNMMCNATADFKVNEQLMKQDVETLNQLKKKYQLELSNQKIINDEFISNINLIEKADIIMNNIKNEVAIDKIDQSKDIKIIFNQY